MTSTSVAASSPPSNFSWCVPDLLCACAFPENEENLQYLVDNNVCYLVSLTAERQVEGQVVKDGSLTVVPLPVRDYTPPTMEQIEEFLDTVDKAKRERKAACIHCAHGLGRTGTMLACYFVKKNKMTPEAAIAHVRNLRPGSVETPEQELLVAEFYKTLKHKK